MNEELRKMYDHIDEIEVAMMTTRRADGHLQSRAMATQRRAAGTEVWCLTMGRTEHVSGPEADRHRNPSHYSARTREWASLPAIATIARDRRKLHELHAPDWKTSRSSEAAPRDGTN